MRLLEKIALVTGAGRGIGKAIAQALAREGATVILASRTLSELDLLKSEIESQKGRAIALPTDLSSESSIVHLFSETADRFGRLDILVNNAGLGYFAPVSELKVEEFDTMWKVNVRGAFLCSQRAIEMMTRQRSGVIVNIDSLAGKNSFIGGAGYAATKWALKGFADCLRLEVRDQNIRVVSIFPGSVATKFHPSVGEEARRQKIVHPEDVAEAVMLAVTMPERTMVSEIDIRPTNPK